VEPNPGSSLANVQVMGSLHEAEMKPSSSPSDSGCDHSSDKRCGGPE
jgi:hypothetical protein